MWWLNFWKDALISAQADVGKTIGTVADIAMEQADIV